jgi:hypothetical protein
VIWLSTHAMKNWLGISKVAHLADLAVSIPLGLAVFYGVCRALKVSELEMAMQSVAGPLRRRLPFLRDKI